MFMRRILFTLASATSAVAFVPSIGEMQSEHETREALLSMIGGSMFGKVDLLDMVNGAGPKNMGTRYSPQYLAKQRE